MSLETNLNISPYFNDFDEAKEFYKILFRPGVSVQVRELNQLQSILQNQVERFGNHVFKNGTIVNGINFQYIPFYPYVKINDVNQSDQPVDLETYANYWVKNSANLVAKVVNFKTGIESRDPDLNTLYLRYLNSGSSNTAQSYVNNEVLTVYSVDYPVFAVNVYNGGSNFSNSDTVVFLSALSVNVASGTFSNGETITQSTTGAQAQIFNINATAFDDRTVLRIKPLAADLSNTSANTSEWTFETGYNISGGTSGAIGSVEENIGSGAVGEPITDSIGVVQHIEVTYPGSGYTFPPHVSLKPISVSASVSTLNVESKNYLTEITIANSSFTAPVGNGYAFAVSEGLIYQKGYFLRADPQLIIVDKYSSAPNNVVVGFDTTETIVSSTQDESLLDNATGTPNDTAPGANRLKLTPTLVTLTTTEAAANTSFLPLVEWSEGNPYKENRVTVYNTLSKEFERRTHESAGDYVIDPFSVATKDLTISASNNSPNTTHFQVIVDPGTAYISGSRVETLRNTLINVEKATETQVREGQLLTASYGSYILVNEFVGSFNVKTGSTVSLRDTAGQALSNTSSFSISAPGSEIGTAKIRSFQFNSGIPGAPESVYEMYLFDIQMAQGKNVRDVKSVFFNGTVKGLADTLLELDATLNQYVTVLNQPQDKSLYFNTSVAAAKVVNTAIYQYRTTNESLSIASNGDISISLVSSGESFPYTASGTLSDRQEEDIILVPTANLEASANLSGSVTLSGNVMTGSSTTFISDLRVGDFVKVANSTTSEIFNITSIANNTYARVRTAPATMSSGNTKLFFPASKPLNFTTRTDRTISLSSNSTVLTASLNVALADTASIAGTYTVRNTADSQVTKSVYRDCFVKLRLSDNAGGTTGPWCLGVPDVIRLKNVYLGNSTVLSTSSVDITKDFFIDAGHSDDSYQLASLVRQNVRTGTSLTSNSYLLVKFDLLQHSSSGGFKTISSYDIDDSKTLTEATNTINTLEIPFNLRNQIDFRPIVTATASVTNAAASATINPSNTNTFDTSLKYFPVPDSEFTYTIESYKKRADRIILNRNGTFEVLKGLSGNYAPPAPSAESMTLGVIKIPPYPSLGSITTPSMSQIATTLIGKGTRIQSSANNYMIQSDNIAPARSMQPVQYTMRDMVRLENRIKALEYQTSFNSLESEINRLTIPSGLDNTIQRFKHGFFVDSFIDNVKADLKHKEFSAFLDFDRGELHPQQSQINLQMKFRRSDSVTNTALRGTSILMLPYAEKTLISQPKATSTVNSDGFKSQFKGSATISPLTFTVEGVIDQSVVIQLQSTFKDYGGDGDGDGSDDSA